MRRLRDISIRTKLVLVILAVSTVSVLAGWVFDLVQERRALRAGLIARIDIQAELIGEYAISPLAFDDPEGTRLILEKAETTEQIQNLALYDAEGRLYARYCRADSFAFPDQLVDFKLDGFVGNHLYSRHEITFRDQLFGTLVVRASAESIGDTLRGDVVSRSLLMLVLIVVAALLAVGLQRFISAPILRIAEVTRRVSEQGDLEIRLDVEGRDEIATLSRGFNKMLGQIEERQRRQLAAEIDLRKSETELADAYRFLQTVLDHMPSPIFYKDLKGRYLGCNRAFAAFSRRSREEIIGCTVFDVTPSELAAEYSRADDELLKQGGVQVYESEVLAPDGTLHDIVFHKAIFKGQDGAPAGIVGVMLDISERKAMERSLAEREEKYRLLADNTSDVIWTLNADLECTYVNPAIETITGFTVEQWLGAGWRHCVDDQSRKLLTETVAAEAAKGPAATGATVIVDFLHMDGSRVPMEIHGNVVFDESGRLAGVQGVSRDIRERLEADSEREALQRQLMQSQKMEAVGRLAGGIAHDFNNLMTVVMNYGEIIRDQLTEADPAYGDVLQILQASERAAELTQQLLAYSRKQIIQPTAVDLNHAVARSQLMLQRLIGEDIDFVFAPGDDLLAVRFDPGQIEQILLNLALNARDAMPDGGKLIVTTRNVAGREAAAQDIENPDHRDLVLLSIRDTGSGMDEETLENIFEPFFTTKTVGKGTGLGMSTVYGIVKQHGGKISVRSIVGEGTTVEILLVSTELEVADPVAPPAPPVEVSAATILLVEDEISVREIAARMLNRHGYQVLVADGPEEAIRLIRDTAPEVCLLLTDVVMPEMSGKACYEKLRELIPELVVIYMSGYTRDVIAERGILDEETLFLAKPFTGEELIRKVHAALGAGGQSGSNVAPESPKPGTPSRSGLSDPGQH